MRERKLASFPFPKSKGKRPLGLPTWSDKLLQEAIRQILEAYYEPQFSPHSYGFRPGRGCHTALREIQQWYGSKWFIEGDICAFFNEINHTLLLNSLPEQIHDNRFLRLVRGFLEAGYLEQWQYVDNYSGVPQGGVLSSILSNLVLDKLGKFVENRLIPANTRGSRRKTYSPYLALTIQAWQARQTGNWEAARELRQQAQSGGAYGLE